LAKNNIPIVPHPPYSPDLAPSDFWLFPMQKMGLRGRRFATVEDIKEYADAIMRAITKAQGVSRHLFIMESRIQFE
jgi:ATP-dependent RNA helicase DDX56/DBP9